MIETQVNLFDVSVIGIMALSCLFAFFRGFVREILSLGAWLGAGIVTLYYFPDVAAKIQPSFKSPIVAAGFATLGIYIAALLVFSIFNMLIMRLFKEGGDIGMLDNSLGLVFGAFRGVFILAIGFFLVTIVMPEKDYPVWLKKSQTRPYVERAAVLLGSVAPKYLRDISSLKDRIDDKRDANAEAREREDEDSPYSKDTSRHLERMIHETEEE